MSVHPVNLALRFALELAALGAIGYWGWTGHGGIWRWALGLGLPVIAAVLWASFRVPGDQERMAQSFQDTGIVSEQAAHNSREPRRALVAVPGVVRLLLEAVFFGGAVLLLVLAGQSRSALILGALVVLHYLASYDRIRWLLGQR